VERATVAVVAEEGGAVVAFLAVTARAPMPDTSGADGHHDASARLAWAKRTARELTAIDGSVAESGSTLWLAACATAPGLDDTRAALKPMLRECFSRAPFAPTTLFFAGPAALLERAPIGVFVEKRATLASTPTPRAKFALYSCGRSDAAPAPRARDARLEDYDDLAALAAFAAGFSPADRAPGGAAFGGFAGTEEDGRSADSVQREMARLIAEARASPETRRVLVAAAEEKNAAAGGAERPRDIVALMAVTTEGVREDARVWAETHDLAAYDDFAKPEEAAAKKAEAAAAATENAGFGGDAPAPADPPGSSPPPAEPEPDEPDEPTSPATLAFANPADPEDGRTRTNDAFRVTAFASLPGYERETRPLLDAAFARFPEVDFCVARVPADAEEVPFTTHEMVRVPPCSGMRAFAEHVLYARHREADAPGFHVRPGAPGDAPGVAELLAGVAGADAEAAAFSEAAEGGGLSAFVATCDGQIVGYLLLDLSVDVRFLRARFRLDEAADEPEDGAFAWLAAYELNPVFAHRRRRAGFVLEALRQAGKTCALYAHAFEEEPDGDGEPKRLPDVVARDFLMARSRRLESPIIDNYPAGENDASAPSRDAEHALFALTSRVAASTRRVVDAKVLVVGGDDVALAAAEALAAHETLLFESVSLAAPAGGVYPGGFPACSAYASSAGGSASGHAGLAKLALGLDRVAYHEADLEAIVLNDGKQSENALLENADENADESAKERSFVSSREARSRSFARFTDGGESRFDVLALCLSSRDETRRAVLGDDADADPALRDVPVERLEDFLQTVRGMPKENRRALADGCECLLVYGATLEALGAPRALARLGFEPASVLRVVPERVSDAGTDGDNSIETTLSLASFAERAVASTPGLGAEALSLPGQPAALRGLTLAGCEACVLPSGARGVRAYFEDQRTGAVTAVEATALLGCDVGDVDPRTHAALDAAGLVTDGGVVVDGAFAASASSRVFAAGDVAKFSKRVAFGSERDGRLPRNDGDNVSDVHVRALKPHRRAMRFRDRRECGVALANAIAARFDASRSNKSRPSSFGSANDGAKTETAPVFARARVEAVTLASGAFFFRAGTPDALSDPGAPLDVLDGGEGDNEYLVSKDVRGRRGGGRLRRRATRADGVFCQIETDAGDTIVALSYAGPIKIDARRFARCVGLPLSLFIDTAETELPKSPEADTVCLWRALASASKSAAFHEDFRDAFAEARRRALRSSEEKTAKKKGTHSGTFAAAAQESVIAFVGKRAGDLPAYHRV
jgi:hypothetical protein